MKKNKFNYIRLFKALVITVCIALIVFAAIEFSDRAKNQVTQGSEDDLILSSDYLKESIHNKTSDLISRLEAYSLFIATFDDLNDPNIHETLVAASEQNNYLNIAIDDLEGNGINLDGEKFNIASRDYFKKARQGKPAVSEVITPHTMGEKCIAYAVPIYKQNTVVGVLHATLTLEDIAKQFNVRSIFKDGMIFVIDNNGELVIGPKETFQKNKTFLNDKERKAFASKSKGMFNKKIAGKEREIYYDLEESSNWYIFTSLNPDVIANDVWGTNRIAFVLVVKIAVILAIMAYFLLLWDRKKNKEIKKQMEEMHTVLKHSPGGVMCYSLEFGKATLEFLSEGVYDIFALSKEEAEEQLKNGYREFFFEDDFKNEYGLDVSKSLDEIYYRIQDSNGEVKWVIERRQFLRDQGVKYIYVSLLDITNLMNVQNELVVSEAKQRMIIEATNLMYFEYDILNKEVSFSKGWLDFSGTTQFVQKEEELQAIKHNNKFIRFSQEALKAHVEAEGCNFEREEYIQLANHEKRWIRIKGTIIVDNDYKPTHIIGLFEDIDKMKKAHRRLEEKSLIDPLTGIYNKASCVAMIEQKIQATAPFLQQVLFVIDVDDFKGVNDTYGHLEGDEVLSQLGFKLLNSFRKNDIVGRIGGDEFIALMSDISIDNIEVIKAKAEQLMCAIDEVKGFGNGVKITCSIGIASYPQDGSTYEELFKKADSALYDVKSEGKSSYHFYKK